MGTCWNCNKQVTLSKEQTKCDKCNTILYYSCNNCKQEFLIEDKLNKLKECKLCGYFICPYCSVCFYGCKKYKWQDEIMRILAPEFSFRKYPVLEKKINQIMEFLIKEKTSNERKECIHNVPITYAKGRIKSLLAKVEGFRVKDEKDRNAFIERMNEIISKEVGFKTTVSASREKGTYGQEYRDAFNLLVCLGKMQITWIPATEDKPEYAMYERIEEKPCTHLDSKNLILNECPKCKKKYNLDIKICSCIYEKGKNKGQNVKLKKRMNNCDICQMYRGDFK